MNYPDELYEFEASNGQRISTPPYIPQSLRSVPYADYYYLDDPQSFQTSLAYFQNQPYRVNTRDHQDYSMYDSSRLNGIDNNLRYQYPNNNGLLDYMQQRKVPNNMQIMGANPQIPPLRSEMARLEEAHKKRNVRPQSLNVPSKSLPPNMDIINLESDESFSQMLQSVRANKDLIMAANNNRSLQYGLQNDELAQALLLNSLNYGKANTDCLMSQLPMDNLVNGINGINDYDIMNSLNPLLMNAICANNSIDNLYKQMQRELLPGLNQEQQLLIQLGQAGPTMMHETLPMKPKKQIHLQEPILIDDDSPKHETYVPMMNMALDKERRVVKEEFLNKPSKPYPVFEEIDDRRGMEVPPQYFQGMQGRQPSLNNKRLLNDRDPEMQLMGTPDKKFETNNGKGIRANPNQNLNMNVMPAQPFPVDLKKVKKDAKLPVKKEKPPVVVQKERPEVLKADLIKQMSGNLTVNAPVTAVNTINMPVSMPPQVVKRPEPQVQDLKRDNKQAEIIINNNNNTNKPKEVVQPKKMPKIQIDKISMPENAVVQQPEPFENIAKAKQSPTMLYLHKKHGQVQINPQQAPAPVPVPMPMPMPIEQVNRQSLQLKLVSGPTVKIESSTELPVTLSNEYTQVQPLMTNPLNVNQSPEKLMEFKESPYQSLAAEPVEEEKLSANGDATAQPKTVGRRKKTEPTEVNTEPAKKERKMNKLQMIRFAYQSYLEEIKKPYKISLHIDPENADEKIVCLKVGEGHQVDLGAALYNRQLTKTHNQLTPSWNPESIAPKKLEEYYQKFGQMIGQKITNEEAALKNLQKFDMDVEKALDNASRNKLYYQNFFRLDQRVLRNRVSYVS